jgi:hypothetical protein
MSKIPEKIGQLFAHIQDTIDNVVASGFKKLNSIEESDNKKVFKNKYAQKTINTGKTVLKGIGRVGKSYYDEYNKLKNDKK